MSGLFSLIRTVGVFVLATSLWLGVAGFAHGQTGAEIRNTAVISFAQGGGATSFPTNEVILVIEAARTESTIEFFRFAPTAPNGVVATINGSQFSPSGELAGPFLDIGAPVTSNGLVLDLSGPVALVPSTRFLAGELMFIKVTDPGQNSSPSIIETLAISVTASTGDEIVLQLFESGPDTGEFIAFVPSSRHI